MTRVLTYVNILNWVGKIKEYCPEESLPAILVGNKIDLRNSHETQSNSSNKIISTEKGRQLAKIISDELNFEQSMFIETSAKTGENVKSGFKQLTQAIHNLIAL